LLVLAIKPVRLYVDALDEMGYDAATRIMRFFKELVSEAKRARKALSICFSCRRFPIVTLDCGLEILVEDENLPGITNYVHGAFEDSGLQGEKAQVLGTMIIERAAGLFMWVVLVTPRIIRQCLRGIRLQTIQAEIERLPQKLHDLYAAILRDIPDNERRHSLLLIQWIRFALRPLSLREMRVALAVGAGPPRNSLREYMNTDVYVETDEDMARRVTDLSTGLAEVRTRGRRTNIHLIHQSVEEYLAEGGTDLLGEATTGEAAIGQANLHLSLSCVLYLGTDEISSLREDDIGMDREISSTYATSSDDGDSTCRHELEEMYPLVTYATLSWLQHAHYAATYLPHSALLPVLLKFHPPSNMRMKQWIRLVRAFEFRPNAIPATETTIFHIVARYGFSGVIPALFDLGDAHVDLRDGGGRTPLSYAAEEGHDTVVQQLLSCDGVDINAEDQRYRRTPLVWAARGGHESVVGQLLACDNVEVNWKDRCGMTPLSWAAFRGHMRIVEMLLVHADIQVDAMDKCNQTPLSKAAQGGHDAIVLKLLSHSGVDPDSKDIYGRSPLSRAAGEGHNMAEELLHNGPKSNLEMQDGFGGLILRRVPGEDGPPVVLSADKENLDDNSRVFQGKPQANWMICRIYPYTEPYTEGLVSFGKGHTKIVRLLLQRGVDSCSGDIFERPSISWAAERGAPLQLSHFLPTMVMLGSIPKTLSMSGHHSRGRLEGAIRWLSSYFLLAVFRLM
jgi:ankyrin repeat protein